LCPDLGNITDIKISIDSLLIVDVTGDVIFIEQDFTGGFLCYLKTPALRSCLNLVLMIYPDAGDATYSTDKVIATQGAMP